MTSAETALLSPSTRSRWLLELLAVLGLLGILLPIMSVNAVVNHGGVTAKMFLLLRMLVLVLVCTWFLSRNGERWADVGLRRPKRWWPMPLLVIGGFTLLLLVAGWMYTVLLPALGAQPPTVRSSDAISGNIGEYLFWALPVAWGSAAFGEEMVVRGFILDRLAKLIGSHRTAALLFAVLVQSVLFGALHMHQGVGGALITGLAGLILGLVWLASGRNLWASIILHGLINFISNTEAFARGL